MLKCGEHWGPGHQCTPIVQLHVVEELLDLLKAEYQMQPEQVDDSDDEVMMSISKLATTGQTTLIQCVFWGMWKDMRSWSWSTPVAPIILSVRKSQRRWIRRCNQCHQLQSRLLMAAHCLALACYRSVNGRHKGILSAQICACCLWAVLT